MRQGKGVVSSIQLLHLIGDRARLLHLRLSDCAAARDRATAGRWPAVTAACYVALLDAGPLLLISSVQPSAMKDSDAVATQRGEEKVS
jgi:hypothetical protein